MYVCVCVSVFEVSCVLWCACLLFLSCFCLSFVVAVLLALVSSDVLLGLTLGVHVVIALLLIPVRFLLTPVVLVLDEADATLHRYRSVSHCHGCDGGEYVCCLSELTFCFLSLSSFSRCFLHSSLLYSATYCSLESWHLSCLS